MYWPAGAVKMFLFLLIWLRNISYLVFICAGYWVISIHIVKVLVCWYWHSGAFGILFVRREGGVQGTRGGGGWLVYMRKSSNESIGR